MRITNYELRITNWEKRPDSRDCFANMSSWICRIQNVKFNSEKYLN